MSRVPRRKMTRSIAWVSAALGSCWCLCLAVAWLMTAPAALAARPASSKNVAVVVTPGSVVRWRGTGIETCSLADRTWAPSDDGCFFPVDLLAKGKLWPVRQRGGQREVLTLKVGRSPYGVQRLNVPAFLVRLSPEDLVRVRRENAEIAPLWQSEGPARFTLPLAAPLAPLPEGARFGVRRFFNGEPRSPHSGTDYTAPLGTPVLAVADGVVVLVGEHFFGGTSLFVDHGGGLVSMYLHLSRADVGQGDVVRRGQAIAAVGASGRALGPHLHFGLRWHGARVNPALLLGPLEALPEVGR